MSGDPHVAPSGRALLLTANWGCARPPHPFFVVSMEASSGVVVVQTHRRSLGLGWHALSFLALAWVHTAKALSQPACSLNYALDVADTHLSKAQTAIASCQNHTAQGAACVAACQAFALAETFPSCQEKTSFSEKPKPPCRALCTQYANACGQLDTALSCQALPTDSGECTLGPAALDEVTRRKLASPSDVEISAEWSPAAVETYKAHAQTCEPGLRASLFHAGTPYTLCPSKTDVDCGTVDTPPAASTSKCGIWLRSLTTMRGGLWESVWRVPLSKTVLLSFINAGVTDDSALVKALPAGTAVCAFGRLYDLPKRLLERLSAEDVLNEQGLSQLVVRSPKYEGSMFDAAQVIVKRFSYSTFVPHASGGPCASSAAPGARADKPIVRPTPQLIPARDMTYYNAWGFRWLSMSASWPGGRVAHYPFHGCEQFGSSAGSVNSNITCASPPFRMMLSNGKAGPFHYNLFLTTSHARAGQTSLKASNDKEGISLTLNAEAAPGAKVALNTTASASAGSDGKVAVAVSLPALLKGGGVDGVEITVDGIIYRVTVHYRPPERSLPFGAFCQHDKECISDQCDSETHACVAGGFGTACGGDFMCQSTRCDQFDGPVAQALAKRERILLDSEDAHHSVDEYKQSYALRRRWLQTSTGVRTSVAAATVISIAALGYNGTCGPAPINFACSKNEHCLSSRCANGKCVSAILGMPCTTDSDCISLKCNASAVCDRAPLNGVCDFQFGGRDCITDSCVDVTFKQAKPSDGESITTAFACGPAEIGYRCASDEECMSGNCGNSVVRRCEEGAFGAHCTEHVQCQSLNCNLAQRQCSKVIFGGECENDSECISAHCVMNETRGKKTCEKSKRNGPCLGNSDCFSNADGTRFTTCILSEQGSGVCGPSPFGLFCEIDADCITGNCDSGICSQGRYGAYCEGGEECMSGSCGENGSCGPSGVGNECSLNAGCTSNYCDLQADSGPVCSLAPYKNACTGNDQCMSTVCDIKTSTCGAGPVGVPCSSNEMCMSGRCSEANLKCSTKPYNSLCTEDGECRSQNCDLTRGAIASYPAGTGLCGLSLPGRDCKDDAECTTDVCSTKGAATPLARDANLTSAPPITSCEGIECMGMCDVRTRFGSECSKNADCLSHECDTTRRTCSQSAPGYPCRRDFDCVTDSCLADGTCALRGFGTVCAAHDECMGGNCMLETNTSDVQRCAPPNATNTTTTTTLFL